MLCEAVETTAKLCLVVALGDVGEMCEFFLANMGELKNSLRTKSGLCLKSTLCGAILSNRTSGCWTMDFLAQNGLFCAGLFLVTLFIGSLITLVSTLFSNLSTVLTPGPWLLVLGPVLPPLIAPPLAKLAANGFLRASILGERGPNTPRFWSKTRRYAETNELQGGAVGRGLPNSPRPTVLLRSSIMGLAAISGEGREAGTAWPASSEALGSSAGS